jgi:hypothetical protein
MSAERDPFETDWQKLVHHPQEDDEWLVPLTRFQALKCAAIAGAVVEGHEGYLSALRDVEAFLQSLAVETGRISCQGTTSTEWWERVDSWPWPRVGGPRPQPE